MRKDIPERKEEILQWITDHESKASICRKLKCKPLTLEMWLSKMGIEYSGNQGLQGKKSDPKRLSALEYLNTENPKTNIIRIKLLKDGLKERKCECCGKTKWNRKSIPLELHHIDQNRFNNVLENLQILCPNCHAQQDGHAGANMGNY